MSGSPFLRAGEMLLRHRDDRLAAYREFAWPVLDRFNWALDYFDVIAHGNARTALHVVADDGTSRTLTFADMSERSSRAANFLRRQGVRRGDRILIMLGNVPELWEITLGAMKLGAVFSPATTLLTAADLQIAKAQVRAAHVGLSHQRRQRSACCHLCPDRDPSRVWYASEHGELLHVEVGLERDVVPRILELHQVAGERDARASRAELELLDANRIPIDHDVAGDTCNVRLPILKPDVAAAGREAYAMTTDLLALDLDAGDRQSDVEALSPIFEAQLRVRYRKLADQVVGWLARTGIFAWRQLRKVVAIAFIQHDMYRRMRDRPSLDDILTTQQSKEAHVHSRSIDVSKRRRVFGSDRAERHVLEDQREVEQVVVETLSAEPDLRICQQPRDMGEHVPFHGRRVQRCDQKKQEEDGTARNHAEKTESASTAEPRGGVRAWQRRAPSCYAAFPTGIAPSRMKQHPSTATIGASRVVGCGSSWKSLGDSPGQ